MFWSTFFQVGEAILLAIRHFSLLCVSIQHGIFCFSMCSSASLVLSFDVFDPVFLVFSGRQFLRRPPPGKIHRCPDLYLSFVLSSLGSLSVVSSFTSLASLSVPSPFLLAVSICNFLFVCTIWRSIFRCAVLIIFSCCSVSVIVPLA